MLPAVWSRDSDRGAPPVEIRSIGLENGEMGGESGMQGYKFTDPTTGTGSKDTPGLQKKQKISPSSTTDSLKLKYVQTKLSSVHEKRKRFHF